MRIGTRGSALALWQARTVARLIEESGGPECEIVVIRTSGDERAGPPDPPAPPLIPGLLENVKAQFVKEIEEALLDGRVDLAVHSAKDLPAALPDGLAIAGALEREDPRDALLLPGGRRAASVAEIASMLGTAPRIGTSSVRRTAQLRALSPAATFMAIRGNVDTRLRKLDHGDCDVLVLAAAGVKRLGLEARISRLLPADVCVPAPAQGIVAIEIAQNGNPAIRAAVSRISDADAEAALIAERAVVRELGGSCQMPLGALATIDGQNLQMQGLVASLDGRTLLRAATHGNRGNPAAVGEKLAAQLLARGAADILKK